MTHAWMIPISDRFAHYAEADDGAQDMRYVKALCGRPMTPAFATHATDRQFTALCHTCLRRLLPRG